MAATEVQMTGDARIYANFWSKLNYTGWNPTGTQTADAVTIWERFRLRSDFIANEGLKFRLGIRVNDTAWGNNTFTVDNPAVSIQVYQAYMQFKWPNTDVQFTVGLQDLALPISNPMLNGNPILSNTQGAAAVVSIPVADQFQIIAGFTRLGETNAAFQTNTTQTADNLDAYFMALPITLEGFQATPWGVFSYAGKQSPLGATATGTFPRYMESNILVNAESASLVGQGIRTPYNPCFWAGTTLAVTALDPFKFYGDAMYGIVNTTTAKRDIRHGWFFDAATEYTGLDMMTPQLTFWYSTGEDGSMRNGSERMPFVVNEWGPTNSFLFDTGQSFGGGHMPVNSVGSWGLVAGLDKISFIKDLTHRLAFTFANGTNDPRALRQANILIGPGNYVQIGRDLTTKEYVYGVNFDNQYNIYENLALILETGWSHGNFQTSVWGHRLANATRDGDAWKAAIGLTYKF
jgi:hypothetical protein